MGAILWPLCFGAFAVFQAGLNRKIIGVLGVGGATLLNAVILTTFALVLVFSGLLPVSPQLRQPGNFMAVWNSAWNSWKLWFFIPGLLGLGLVVGLPVAVSRWGALQTFIWMISAQLVLSPVWDWVFEGRDFSEAFSKQRILGGSLALIGSWIATRS